MNSNSSSMGPPGRPNQTPAEGTAVLDEAHLGNIRGALGTIAKGDVGPRRGLSRKTKTLLAIVGPGLIVMAGDNDAGAFSTYSPGRPELRHPSSLDPSPARSRCSTSTRRWSCGSARSPGSDTPDSSSSASASSGAPSASSTCSCSTPSPSSPSSSGSRWPSRYLGLPKIPRVLVAAVAVIAAVSTGSFRRFERLCLVLVVFSLLLIPLFLVVHPPIGQVAHDFVVPGLRRARLSTVMLLIIGIVGTTVAPWQLFFQQSYVIDKRITPRWINYERVDLVDRHRHRGHRRRSASWRSPPPRSPAHPGLRQLHRHRRDRRWAGDLCLTRHRRSVRHRPHRRRHHRRRGGRALDRVRHQ